jgi:hypothetical protein
MSSVPSRQFTSASRKPLPLSASGTPGSGHPLDHIPSPRTSGQGPVALEISLLPRAAEKGKVTTSANSHIRLESWIHTFLTEGN